MQNSDRKNDAAREEWPLPEPDTAHERNRETPASDDLADPAEVWKDAETTPSGQTRRTGGGRVADAGDVGGGTPSPYSEETQAETVARQTRRSRSGD